MDLIAIAVKLALAAVLYFIIHRLFLHPLAKVPGPKLAALTSWHEFYYDCIKGVGGQHEFEIRRMYDQYGECTKDTESLTLRLKSFSIL